ncbi:MAG TPA: FAD-dependent oxidoreductase [Anaerolineales bacterium]|nr:FAD-dependent oxidoreductase [Anaerolineales bacterium]
MAHILILGAGFGGVPTARRLRELLPDPHRITLIDKRDEFMVGFRKTLALLGESTPEEGRRKLVDLRKFGIDFVRARIEEIDPAGLSATAGGHPYHGDAMIVALGADLDPDAIPGFREHALSVYDPDLVEKNAARLQAFGGGRVLVGVFGKPYKCPPAPYELAILLQEHFKKRALPAEITVFTPLPVSLPVLDATGCESMDRYMLDRGIRFLTQHTATRVESGAVHFENGEALEFDLLLGVAPHRPPAVVRESGLTGGAPWIKVDPFTLETAFPNVYAIGDVTVALMGNGDPLPKAGVFAEGGGLVAAERIAARIEGRTPAVRYDGDGGCFLEIGGGQAVMIRGQFLTEGGPQAELTPPSEKFMEEKWAFERSRLEGWFG